MSGNTFGEIFRVTTFGESHGPAIGAVIDGVPAGLALDTDFIRHELDRRRPGQSALSTPRKEPDQFEILSGIFDGVTTGTPLALLIRNTDQHSRDYAELAHVFRPGHADRGYWEKYGIRDYRGGGRSSGRETAARVAAGAVAKLFLRQFGVKIVAFAEEIAGIRAQSFCGEEIEKNSVRCADPAAAKAMEEAIRKLQTQQDSAGGIVGCTVSHVPAGWGEPVFDKLDALLAHAMLSLGAVKGIEFGSGFEAARLRGSQNNDPMTPVGYGSNHAGGILGGISNGDDITFRIAVKPTPSIAQKQQTVNEDNEPAVLEVRGRHDPCIVPRIIPVVEAMTALVLADCALRNFSSVLPDGKPPLAES